MVVLWSVYLTSARTIQVRIRLAIKCFSGMMKIVIGLPLRVVIGYRSKLKRLPSSKKTPLPCAQLKITINFAICWAFQCLLKYYNLPLNNCFKCQLMKKIYHHRYLSYFVLFCFYSTALTSAGWVRSTVLSFLCTMLAVD